MQNMKFPNLFFSKMKQNNALRSVLAILSKCDLALIDSKVSLVIYSKSCYVSPHMSEMELKEPKNTRFL